MKLDFSKCRSKEDVEKVFKKNKKGLGILREMIEFNWNKKSAGESTESLKTYNEREKSQ